MTTTCRWRRTTAAFSLAVIGFGLSDHRAFAGWPLHKQQVVYATPVVPAQAPVVYAAQAPVAVHRQAPVAYAWQAAGTRRLRQAPPCTPRPRPYAAQAPVAYAAQAPTTYAISTAAAAGRRRAAPGTADAPTEQGIRISHTVRNALFADLVAYYHSEDSGDTRAEKIVAVRDRAREEFEALLEGEDNPELNSSERQDLNTLVDWVIAGGPSTGQRTYYPPAPQADAGAGRPGTRGPVRRGPVTPTRGWRWCRRPSTSRSS